MSGRIPIALDLPPKGKGKQPMPPPPPSDNIPIALDLRSPGSEPSKKPLPPRPVQEQPTPSTPPPTGSSSRHLSTISERTEAGPPPPTALSVSRRPTPAPRSLGSPGSDVSKVLSTKFTVKGRSLTIGQTKSHMFFDRAVNQPFVEMVNAIHDAVWRHDLCSAEMMELFTELEWSFSCISCGQRKLAPAFDEDRNNWVLWDDVDPPRPKLRAGPCKACAEHARRTGQAGAGYKVVAPPRNKIEGGGWS